MSRIKLPVPGRKRAVDCTECGLCCTYVGIDINAPTSLRRATDVLWYLYHEGVYVYVDGEGEWSVHFEARCRNLGDDLLCGIYSERPHICRGFDSGSCEVNDHNRKSRTFRQPAEFLVWLRERRPRLYAKIENGFVPRRRMRAETSQGARIRSVARRAGVPAGRPWARRER